jgi:Putative auto-transporter adhesin, head GIN domain
MKLNPKYLYLLLVPIVLIILFQLVNIPLGIFRTFYSTNAPGNSDQVSKTITVANYDEINVVGSMDVDLVAGKEGEVTVTAPSNIVEYIKVESQNNALQIYSDQWKNFGFIVQFGNNNRTLVTVPYESLNRIKLTGSGKVTSKNPITTDSLIVNSLGSGNIDLDVAAGNLESNTSGSGDITLQGKANNFVADVFGSGSIKAAGLESQNAKASISGSGDINLFAAQSFKAGTFGSGSIYYKGDPKINDVQVTGSGQVKKIE